VSVQANNLFDEDNLDRATRCSLEWSTRQPGRRAQVASTLNKSLLAGLSDLTIVGSQETDLLQLQIVEGSRPA
jgi:hypothetical protein